MIFIFLGLFQSSKKIFLLFRKIINKILEIFVTMSVSNEAQTNLFKEKQSPFKNQLRNEEPFHNLS